MIQEVEGDILLTGAAATAHGVAPFDNFSNGLALSLRERFPSMARDFRHYCQQANPKPGEIWLWTGVGQDGRPVRIVNLLTQLPAEGHVGTPGPATLPTVNHALKALAVLATTEKLGSIALPRLATGVGGLDWREVRPLLDKSLGGLGIPVVVYSSYRKGVKAAEKLPLGA